MRKIDQTAFVAAHRDGAVVIDVREPFEYVEDHVPGAQLMPLAQLPSRVGDLPRNVPVYIVCASGNHSLSAADFLFAAGINGWSAAGGIGTWIRAGRPLVRGAQAAA